MSAASIKLKGSREGEWARGVSMDVDHETKKEIRRRDLGKWRVL